VPPFWFSNQCDDKREADTVPPGGALSYIHPELVEESLSSVHWGANEESVQEQIAIMRSLQTAQAKGRKTLETEGCGLSQTQREADRRAAF
jgi:hypothetical protein